MKIENAQGIFDEVARPRDEELKLAVWAGAIRYALLRAEWAQSSVEQRREMDASRTRAHYALIDACNLLGRTQARLEVGNNWRTTLGKDRQSIGGFACFIHLFLALSAR